MNIFGKVVLRSKCKWNWEFLKIKLGKYITFVHGNGANFQLHCKGSDGPESIYKSISLSRYVLRTVLTCKSHIKSNSAAFHIPKMADCVYCDDIDIYLFKC